VGTAISAGIMENGMEVLQIKNYKYNYHKIQISHFWVYIQRKWINMSQRHLHTLFTAALLTQAKMWKQRKCPLMDDG
jgi:hypothetical protein